MAKLAIPEIGLNKAARAVAGWSPCTHEQRSSSGFRVCRGAIWPKFRPAAFAKALRHSCRAAFAALRGLNLGSNQQSHYFQTLPSHRLDCATLQSCRIRVCAFDKYHLGNIFWTVKHAAFAKQYTMAVPLPRTCTPHSISTPAIYAISPMV